MAKKGGLKAHVRTRAKDQVPCFVDLTAASKSYRTFVPMLALPPGSIISMDKAYVNYKVMKSWMDNNITWIIRLTTSMKYQIEKENVISQHQLDNGVIYDAVIMLGNPKTKSRNPLQTARLIRYHDEKKNREFEFLCNNVQYSPLTIAELYRRRWDIEGLFRRIEQNFQFHNFLGDSENDIKIQMWCTLIADLLIAIVKRQVDKIRRHKWAFSNITSLIRQHLTTYIDLFKFLTNPEKAILGYSQQTQTKEYQLQIFIT